MDSEVKAEEERLTGHKVRNKYLRAVETSRDRILAWLAEGPEYNVNPSDIESVIKFMMSHRQACVWAVLRSKQIHRLV